MPQSKEVHRKYMEQRRKVHKDGSQTEGSQEGSQQYPAIIDALTDPVKRKKLEAITQSLKDHNVLGEVRYGVFGPTFDTVGELLEATR